MRICPKCNGSGEGLYDGSWCWKCGGDGEISEDHPHRRYEENYNDSFQDEDEQF